MLEILKKIASFVWDVPVEKTGSKQNEYLEVVWSMGKKMLNTKNANFSFGSGYKVFRYAFELERTLIRKANRILVLGFGCGSVEALLMKDYKFKGELVGVEYDNKILELYHKHFEPKTNHKLKLHHRDAFTFINQVEGQFDLIVVDLFDDLRNINGIYEINFIKDLHSHLTSEGLVIFNTVANDKIDKSNLLDLNINLSKLFNDVVIKEFQKINQIVIAKQPK